MASSTPSLTSTTSTTSVTRTQYRQQAPVQQPPVKTTAQKEQESPTLNLTGDNDLGQPNIDGTGASFSILV
jgi:hypothetical protein